MMTHCSFRRIVVKKSIFLLLLCLRLAVPGASAAAFVPAPNGAASRTAPSPAVVSVVALRERRWNFNEGQSPWGLKKNAEIWNGRAAQVAFVVVFLQELVQGKGVVQGLQEGDPVNVAVAGAAAASVLGLTVWLAIKGDDDYVARELGKK